MAGRVDGSWLGKLPVAGGAKVSRGTPYWCYSGRPDGCPGASRSNEYLEHRSNVARVRWSWALRKHTLRKELKLLTTRYYLLGLGGLAFAEGIMILGEWALYGKGAMWMTMGIVLIANILGIIAWIIGDNDDLPPRPAPDKPLPVPGLARPLPKTRPRAATGKVTPGE